MLPRLKSSILTGKLQRDAHICGNPTPLCLPLSLHLEIHLCHHSLLCAADYFPSVCLPTTFPKQFALTTATAFAVLNHSVIDFLHSPSPELQFPSDVRLLQFLTCLENSKFLSNINANMPQSSICAVYKNLLQKHTKFPCDRIYQPISLLIWREWIFSFHFRNDPKNTTHFFHSTDSLTIIKKKRRGGIKGS